MKTEIAKLLFKAIKEEAKKQEVGVDLTEEKIINLIEIPPSVEMGDYAFPCFILSKYFKIAPQEVSILIRKNLPTKNFSDIQTAGPYINFFVDRNKSTLNLIKSILKQKEKFGGSDVGGGDKVLIEFSQPNTHKAFHVGHIRGTSIGESLSRISEFSKNKVIRANYSGDTGMHIAKWIWCYGKYHSREKLKNDESWIASVYVDAVKRLARNKKSQDEVNVINQKIENKSDKTINRIWAKTRKLSIESWKKIYQELNTKFDVHFFESEVEIPGREIALDLLKKALQKKVRVR